MRTLLTVSILVTNKIGQLYRVPHGILLVFNTILYEIEFQNPQVFHQHLRFSPERSTLVMVIL
jgi:hypothetical protein